MRALLGRTLHEVALVLESAAGSEERMLSVLELLRRIVPYEQCALFIAAERNGEPRLLLAPEASTAVRTLLSETLIHLHRRLVDERAQPMEARARPWEAHLAVPLVGNDAVFGVLFVSGAAPHGSAGAYTEEHLRELSIVGAQLAGYLAMVDQARTLDKARRDAEAANRRKDEFLALVSHELRTPLNSTLAWAHVLGSEETVPAGRARAVEAIERNVHAQRKLIDEILELACVMTAGLRLRLEAVEPKSLIQAAVEEQRTRAEQRSIRLEAAIDESVNQLVVDPARIVQVISNLLAKAIHFTPSGGKVGVRLERAGAHARIRVIDEGGAIPPEAVPRAFEEAAGAMSLARLTGVPLEVLSHVLETLRLQQNPVARAYGELGVGLAVVKSLVEAHGGRVCAETLGAGEKGSTVTIELPLPAETPETGQRPLAGIRVLLVDDDKEMRSAVGAVLEQQGADVTAVASAAAALEALERSRPHVLLSDLSMPGKSGYDLMREVAARDATLPAAALTAWGSEEDRGRALAAGFRMHLAKPLDAQTLVTAVASLAGRSLAKSLGAAITH
jgi:signal transduction histidine kinase/ActR/RegA family two-component response regulator